MSHPTHSTHLLDLTHPGPVTREFWRAAGILVAALAMTTAVLVTTAAVVGVWT